MPLPIIPLAIGLGVIALLATQGPRKDEPVRPAPHREPLPDLEIVAEFQPQVMAEVATECLQTAQLPEGDPSMWTSAEFEAAEQELAACMGDAVYPEILWPAVEGDHPSIELAWQKLLALSTEVISEVAQGPIVEPGRPLPPVPEPLEGE